MDNLPVFLINLDGSEQRLASSTAQLNRIGWEFIRVPAFDGRKADPKSFHEYDEHATLRYMGRQMTGGELGCLFSHRDCLNRFLKTDAPYAVILEDDVEIADAAPEVIRSVLDWLEQEGEQWDLINIGATQLKIATQLTQIKDHALLKAHYFPMLTSGLIWSRAGAERILGDKSKIYAPVDNYYRDVMSRLGSGLAIWPPLVAQCVEMGSDITSDGPARRVVGRSTLYGLRKQKRLLASKFWALRHKYL